MNNILGIKKYALEEIDKQLGDSFWSPIDVAHINDWVLRLSAVKGEFHWHKHDDDEFFLIYKGEIVIETENGPIHLKEGEATVIPKGTKHRPSAEKRAVVIVLEPARVKSRGD